MERLAGSGSSVNERSLGASWRALTEALQWFACFRPRTTTPRQV